jgi:hypothetical protein
MLLSNSLEDASAQIISQNQPFSSPGQWENAEQELFSTTIVALLQMACLNAIATEMMIRFGQCPDNAKNQQIIVSHCPP